MAFGGGGGWWWVVVAKSIEVVVIVGVMKGDGIPRGQVITMEQKQTGYDQ